MAVGVWQQWLWDSLSILLLPASPAYSTECRAGSWAAANRVKLPINQVFRKNVSDWFHNVLKIIKGKHFKYSIIYTNHLYFLSTFPHSDPLTLWDSCHALEDVSFLISALIAAKNSGNEEKYHMTGDCAGDKKCNAIYYRIVYAGSPSKHTLFQNQDNLQSTTAKFGLYSSLLFIILIFHKAFFKFIFSWVFPCWLFTLNSASKVMPPLHGLALKGFKCKFGSRITYCWGSGTVCLFVYSFI